MRVPPPPAYAEITFVDSANLLNIFHRAVDVVNFYWNFYVVGIIAVLGWLMSHKRDLSRSQRMILTMVYIGFIALNLLALANAYSLLEAARLDILYRVSRSNSPNVWEMLNSISFARQRWMGWVVHGLVDVAVILAIWLIRASPAVEGQATSATSDKATSAA